MRIIWLKSAKQSRFGALWQTDRQVGSDMPRRDADNDIKGCHCLHYPSLYSRRWGDWINYATGKSKAFHVAAVLTEGCSSPLKGYQAKFQDGNQRDKEGEIDLESFDERGLGWKKLSEHKRRLHSCSFALCPRCHSKICQTHTLLLVSHSMKPNWCWIRFHVQHFILVSFCVAFFFFLKTHLPSREDCGPASAADTPS